MNLLPNTIIDFVYQNIFIYVAPCVYVFALFSLFMRKQKAFLNALSIPFCLLLALSGVVALTAYFIEAIMAIFGGNSLEKYLFYIRIGGPYCVQYWLALIAVAFPILFLFRYCRRSPWIRLLITLFIVVQIFVEIFLY